MSTHSYFPGADSEEAVVLPPRMALAASKIQISSMIQRTFWKTGLKTWDISTDSRFLMLFLFALIHATVFLHGFLYYTTDGSITERSALGPTFATASAAGLVLHLDLVTLMFPACRTLVSLLRQTPLDRLLDISSNVSLHKLTAWSMLCFAVIHTIAHICSFAYLAAQEGQGFKEFLLLNLATGPGMSGYLMLTLLMLVAITSLEAFRRADYSRFWITHHLYVIFFPLWSIHGTFCMFKTDGKPACAGLGTSWQYWICGGVFYLIDKILSEWRGRHQSFILKVIQHPNNVLEMQVKKEKTLVKVGQYIYLCCPEVAICQDRPLALTSAPEEEYLSVHIECSNACTQSLAAALGCKVEQQIDKRAPYTSAVVGVDCQPRRLEVDPTIRRLLPSIFIDGPFGGTSTDLFQFESVILAALGDRIEPFSSILKSIWYRMNYPSQRCCIRKVYFVWACNDFCHCEWFISLLMAIEAQDLDNNIEIYTYVTSTCISKDAMTAFRTPTKLGLPDWSAFLNLSCRTYGPKQTCFITNKLDRMGLEYTVL